MKIVFDTDCLLCSGWVHFVIRHERAAEAKFISAWTEEGRRLAAAHGLDPADLDKTFLVEIGRKGLARSDAALAIIARLKRPWCWLRHLRFVPRPLRDGVYNLVARHRYRIFGRKAQCFVPPPDQRHRFISGPPRP